MYLCTLACCNRLKVELEETRKLLAQEVVKDKESFKGEHATRYKLESELDCKWTAFDGDMFKLEVGEITSCLT